MKKNLTPAFFENGYKMIASEEDDRQHFQQQKTEANNEAKSNKWELVFDPSELGSDFAVWDNSNYRIISDCGVSSLYKKLNDNEPTNRNLKIQA